MLWVAIEDDHFFLKIIFKSVTTIKTPKNCNDEDFKKDSYDFKVRNILISSISANVYYSISDCKTGQLKWNIF